MDYQLASAADFAADEFFIQWVKAPTAESNGFWQDWLEQNPSKYEVVLEARELVKLLSEDEDEQAKYQTDVEEVWQRLHQVMQQDERGDAGKTNIRPINFWQSKRMLVAASVGTLLLMAGFFLFGLLEPQTLKYATAYGEKRTIVLPDSSVVVLNGNSSISYANEWEASETRLVNLTGEAYFSVKHKVNHQKFLVQTPEGTQVEVLGTEFDVTSREGGSRVVLASGKVRLNYSLGQAGQQLTMQPGDLVEVPAKKGGVIKKKVRPENYTSWKDNKIIFDNTTLREIAMMLEQVYGYRVDIKDSVLANQKLTASLDNRGVDNILKIISETLDAAIAKQDNTITIRLSNNQ